MISDAGPIIIFARLSLLLDITGCLLVLEAVDNEIVTEKSGVPGAAEVAHATWMQKDSVEDLQSSTVCRKVFLHEGEREAIALGKERVFSSLLITKFVPGEPPSSSESM
jgi:predicted nucleic acid-binding protein